MMIVEKLIIIHITDRVKAIVYHFQYILISKK